MCKEMPVIPVNKVVDKKRRGKMEGQGGGETQGVADPKKKTKKLLLKNPCLTNRAQEW
jgi:hypothetical protein